MANVSSFSGAMPVIPGGLVELGVGTATSNVVVNTGYPTVTTIIPNVTVVTDGSPIELKFDAPFAYPGAASGTLTIGLYRDGTELVRGWSVTQTTSTQGIPVSCSFRDTPTAGSHTYSVRGYYSGSTWTLYAGTNITYPPITLRISKIVSQNDGLKPFWTPPLVTQLPAFAHAGDQIVYQHTGTNNVGALLPMRHNGTAWKPLGQATLCRWSSGSASQVINSTAVAIMTNGDYNTVTFTPPWDGYYEIGINLQNVQLNSGIGLYVLFNSSTDTYSHQLAYFEDANGAYHTRIPVTGPRTEYLYAAQTYRWKAVITYASGNQGTIFSAGNAYVKAVA